MSFEISWQDAENTVMDTLLAATGGRVGVDAFQGYLPPVANCWALFTGGQGGNEQTSWHPSASSMHFGARILSQWVKRENALKHVMQVLQVLPLTNTGNVQNFRVRMGGYPEPQVDMLPLANDKKVMLWTVEIGCELVFSTGGR